MELAPQEIRTYFLTCAVANSRRLFQVDSNARLLIDVLAQDRARARYQLHAFVVMPDHIHLLLTPSPHVSIEKAVQFVKGGFSFRLRSNFPVWPRGFYPCRIVDAPDYSARQHYIHTNPVRAHLCDRPEAFPYSSAGGDFTVDPPPFHLQPAQSLPSPALL